MQKMSALHCRIVIIQEPCWPNIPSQKGPYLKPNTAPQALNLWTSPQLQKGQEGDPWIQSQVHCTLHVWPNKSPFPGHQNNLIQQSPFVLPKCLWLYLCTISTISAKKKLPHKQLGFEWISWKHQRNHCVSELGRDKFPLLTLETRSWFLQMNWSVIPLGDHTRLSRRTQTESTTQR